MAHRQAGESGLLMGSAVAAKRYHALIVAIIRLPKHWRFKPGQFGNPGGRPKPPVFRKRIGCEASHLKVLFSIGIAIILSYLYAPCSLMMCGLSTPAMLS